jgi:hypothetical protein
MYSSDIQKEAEESQQLRQAPVIGRPTLSINSFFKMQTSGADIPSAADVCGECRYSGGRSR